MVHTGRAVVFENIEDFYARIDDEELDIDEHCIMVLKNCGPKGYPGMAEVGNMPLPPKLLRRGITDMVRISDARMSGTAYGTVVLHAVQRPRPEVSRLSEWGHDRTRCANAETTIAHQRRGTGPPNRAMGSPVPPLASGYWKLYVDHVLQADEGVDLDFLVGSRGSFVPRDNH